jgi:hypothetical protein
MKVVQIIILGLLLQSCSSYNFSKNNIAPAKISNVKQGQTIDEVIHTFGTPLKNGIAQNGGFIVYSSDYEENNLIDCRDFVIRFERRSDKLIVSETYLNKNKDNALTRCHAYVAKANSNLDTGSSFSWANLFNELSGNVTSYQKNRYRSNATTSRFCYYNEYSSSPTCFNSLGECKQAIRVNRGGACSIE